jgi:hypothetical protein
MRRFALALGVLALSMLACGTYVTPTPTVSPAAPTLTPAPLDTLTAIPSPAPSVEAQTAVIVKPVVLVHSSADGPVLSDKYLVEGNEVVIVVCKDNWCEISKPVGGFVYQGCLDAVAGDLKCEAAK